MTKVLPLKNFQDLQPPTDQEKKLRQAAEMYEKHFLGEMVKAMRSTIDYSEMTKPSMGENIYRQHLDEEYVNSWVGRGGIGLSDLIVDQIKEKMMGQPISKPKGPLPLNNKSNFQLKDLHNNENKIEYNIQTKEAHKPSAMWDGKVINHFKHDEKSVLDLEFTNGLKARILAEGYFLPEKMEFKAGDTLLGQSLSQYSLQIFTS